MREIKIGKLLIVIYRDFQEYNHESTNSTKVLRFSVGVLMRDVFFDRPTGHPAIASKVKSMLKQMEEGTTGRMPKYAVERTPAFGTSLFCL